jgi:hypothetical protein
MREQRWVLFVGSSSKLTTLIASAIRSILSDASVRKQHSARQSLGPTSREYRYSPD